MIFPRLVGRNVTTLRIPVMSSVGYDDCRIACAPGARAKSIEGSFVALSASRVPRPIWWDLLWSLRREEFAAQGNCLGRRGVGVSVDPGVNGDRSGRHTMRKRERPEEGET